MRQEQEDALVEKLARVMLTDFARTCGYTGTVQDDHPLWTSYRRDARAALPAVRQVLAETLRTAAEELREAHPDPNPLGSLFKPYVGAEMVTELLEKAHEVSLPPEELALRRTCTWPSCLSEEEQKQLAEEILSEEPEILRPDPRPGCGCTDPES